MRHIIFAFFWMLLIGCVEDTELTPRVWGCLWNNNGDVDTWSASQNTVQDAAAAKKECEFQSGANCFNCSLDEVSSSSAPYYCVCGGTCDNVSVSTDWSGSALTKIAASQQCIYKLNGQCPTGLDLTRAVWSKCQ